MTSYFSVNPEFLKKSELPFDVYINSSASSKQKFVCLFKPGTAVSPSMIDEAKKRFYQLYLREEDRSAFLDFVAKSKAVSVHERAQVLKESAAIYLEQIVGVDWQNTKPEYLAACVMQCRDLVNNLIDVVETESLDQIKIMLKDLAVHDFYTFDHSVNVCIYAIRFYQYMFPNHDKEKVLEMGLGALLHDIGKSRVATAIINKPSDLNVEEYKVIKNHPGFGREIFLSMMHLLPRTTNWHHIIDIIYQHHENIDGSGYPLGLKSQEINVYAKVCMLADIFDALTTKRSYSDVLGMDRALELMKKMVGRKIDPLLFNKLLPQLESMQNVKALPQDNLVLHPFFDPSVPYSHLELVVDMPISSYDSSKSPVDYGKVIIVPEKNPKKAS